MSLSELNESIACAAHREWCSRMTKAGWGPGERLDLDKKTHPALQPYEELALYWRHQLLMYLESELHAEQLVDAVEIVLGEPEWTVADVHVGMRVAFVSEPGTVGLIASWDLADAESGALQTIRVRWPDGGVEEYCPAEHALVRVPD
ncbi:MAG: hypothetical protein K8E66_08840 [Phycisphaerales bacterium]|nr:hypothetical protein [Phycisphaerales bacterium]